jgi:hypothetical protein
MTIKINVRSNIKEFTKNLNSFARKQVPDATRSTLNETAMQLRKNIIDKTYPKSFTVRNKTFPKLLFRFVKATRQKLESAVLQKNIDGRHFDVITKSATGGVRRASGGRLAVPTSNVRLTGRGVRKNRRPRNVINSGKGFIKENKIFFQKSKRNLQLLYILKQFVRIKKTFPFMEDSQRFVDKNIKNIFGKALAFRISKARMR